MKSERKKYKTIRINGRAYPLHRVFMSLYIGRELTKKEIVHHINDDSLDNRIENLKIVTKAEHIKIHHLGRKDLTCYTTIKCENCGKQKQIYSFNCKPNKLNFCSVACRQSYRRPEKSYTANCIVCGKKIKRFISQKVSTVDLCSRKCTAVYSYTKRERTISGRFV